VTDPILPLLIADTIALLVLSGVGGLLPRGAASFATAGLSGLGMLLCLPPLLPDAATSALELPLGPPGLSMGLFLDPLSAFFQLMVFLCGTAVAAFSAIGQSRAKTSRVDQPRSGPHPDIACIPLGLAGLSIFLLAADAITLAVGSTLATAACFLPDRAPVPVGRSVAAGLALPVEAPPSPATAPWTEMPPLDGTSLSTPLESSAGERPQDGMPRSRPRPDGTPWLRTALPTLLLVIAVCLLTPSGVAPHFAGIRSALIDPGRAAVAAALAVVAGMTLLRQTAFRQRPALDAFTAGAMAPCTGYLMIRLTIDLPGVAAQGWWGYALLLLGGTVSIAHGWRAAKHSDLSGAVAHLMRRQTGLVVIGLGLTLIARSADLPDAASLGLAATLLLTLASGVAGTLASLATHTLGQGAGSYRIIRLGGLIHSMPVASCCLMASLMALSALPPGAGFAALWLLFQTILSAPRTGGLPSQLPLVLIAGALALSSALATAASIRLIGIALLSRPRSVRGSAAQDVAPRLRLLLLTLSGIALLLGVLPGPALRAFAGPAIWTLTGTGLAARAGWMTLSASASSPGYSPLPVFVLLVLATGSAKLIVHWTRGPTRLAGLWSDGLAASPELPFGDPQTQSTGQGFLPASLAAGGLLTAVTAGLRPAIANLFASLAAIADLAVSHSPSLWHRRPGSTLAVSSPRLPATSLGFWAILLIFIVVLLMLSFSGGGAPSQ
jgi:hydrogenase-4 component B